jgi:hypothetical protein
LPKNFIMLYDNTAGTGRPVSGTFIESDGTDESVANGYAPFYASNVDGIANTWGSIIPNNLGTGINNIAQYSLTNATLISTCVSVNGVFGTTNTSNASGGLTELVLNTSCTTLPVSLLSFTGTSSAGKAKLRWTTAAELNFSGFVVERLGTGNAFNAIGSRTATGDNSVYGFEEMLSPGVSFYRLKLIDHDGHFSYSNTVKLVNNNGETSLSVFPNPVIKNQLTLNHPVAAAGAVLQLYGMNGQCLLTRSVTLNSLQTKIDLAVFAPGVYVLKYCNNREVKTVRFEKF